MRTIPTLGAVLLSIPAWCQVTYINSPALLGTATASGGCMGVCDMNDDGRDDIAILDNSDHVIVKYQNADGTFTAYDYGTVSSAGQWGWAIGDIDNNGHKDVVSGGSYDGTHYVRISSPGVFTTTDLNGPDIFTQCMSLGDLDNNGRVDVFSCHDDGSPNIWFTDAAGVPQINNAYINWATACSGTSGDMSGNYGSTFTDFDNDGDLDLYISHCRQGVNDPNDCRRWNRLFVNDGTNHYTDDADLYGLENHYQTWTSDFGDYDNDGDMDVVSTNHDNTMMLFENDGTGHYTEVTAGSGLEVTGFFLQGLFRDFDNDGYLDVLTSSAHHYFKGNGDGTFDEVTNVFPASATMHSFAIGDLNEDGFEDVFASYGDGYINPNPSFPDRLWLAVPNNNHWFRVRLQGTISNRDAIGARVKITGPFGQMIREVHAGESYGLVNSFALNFGMGTYTDITTVEIHWPSGIVETYGPFTADQTITAIEGACIAPVAEIIASGPAIVCTGGAPLTLTANPGYNYTWSVGGSSQSIDVSQGGTITVTIDDGAGCTDMASIFVEEDPDETPTVSLSGEPTFCDGDEVTLTASDASGWSWSNGPTSQSITVGTAGTYSVTVDGFCGPFTSEPVEVTVLSVPAQPAAADVFLSAPGTADLTATGANVIWYDDAAGTNQVGEGSPWTTPFLSATTTYYVADVNQVGGDEYYGGPANRISTASPLGQYHTNADNYEIFEAYEDMVIRSVKVYAQGAAFRTIAVIDENTGTTLASGSFSVPDGESRVQLDFEVPAGGPYGLRCISANPLLWRDGNGTNPPYPFALGTLGSITTSSVDGANALEYYYFFYDWEVETPSWSCASTLEDVVVDVATGMNEWSSEGMTVWPNPAQEQLNIRVDGSLNGVELLDVTGRVVGIAAQANGNEAKLDVSGMAPGEYLLRVRTNERTALQRIVVR